MVDLPTDIVWDIAGRLRMSEANDVPASFGDLPAGVLSAIADVADDDTAAAVRLTTRRAASATGGPWLAHRVRLRARRLLEAHLPVFMSFFRIDTTQLTRIYVVSIPVKPGSISRATTLSVTMEHRFDPGFSFDMGRSWPNEVVTFEGQHVQVVHMRDTRNGTWCSWSPRRGATVRGTYPDERVIAGENTLGGDRTYTRSTWCDRKPSWRPWCVAA